jgi:hypothetical protein
MTGGFGEQCDLWEEKQVSELGRYGPGDPCCARIVSSPPSIGITNYFKFIKWCFWAFVILVVLNLPALVLNTFGRGDQQSVRLNSLSQTMVRPVLILFFMEEINCCLGWEFGRYQRNTNPPLSLLPGQRPWAKVNISFLFPSDRFVPVAS